MHTIRTLILVLAGMCLSPFYAHEYWLKPSLFKADLYALVVLHTLVGHKFAGEALPRNPYHINQFVFANVNGVAKVMGMDGKKPAGVIRVRTPGIHTIGYYSNRTFNKLAAEQFEAYLKEEGLDFVIKLRAERNESKKQGLEYYSRYAKTLIAVDKNFTGPYNKVFGFPLELIPEDNPFTFPTGKEFTIRLMYQGKPLAGVLVKATHKEHQEEVLSQKTDKEGRVRFKLAWGGTWLVNTVHMTALPAGMDADWESFWGSLYFEIPNTNAKKDK